MFGDSRDMFGNAHGGNDTLIGGVNATNYLYGDAYSMYDNAHRRQRHADRRATRLTALWRRLRHVRQRPRRQ